MGWQIRQVALAVRSVDDTVSALKKHFDLCVGHRDSDGPELFGINNALVPIGNQFAEIIESARSGSKISKHIERVGGDSGYALLLQCTSDSDFDAARANADAAGMRFVLDFERLPYRTFQLHPKDCGGTLLEIDNVLKGDPTGWWYPAGGLAWQGAVRTGQITGIAAVELSVGDPKAVAARWAQVLGVKPSECDDGARLVLDRGTVRFHQAEHDEREGISAIEVSGLGSKVPAPPHEELVLGGVRWSVAPESG